VLILTSLFPDKTDDKVYRVLARKYRPNNFAELIGQESMVRTLSNAIESGRLPQAWMLTGVRGIGKTTTARIIAKALNCTGRDENEKTIEPCGSCDACIAISEDRYVDVQEMDAASRTSVDDIREIVDSVRYAPVAAKYKIYILDEVHMLSKNAFNALLKTLEEPPPHTKFIFATTEIRKVPVTVLSRCQRFDLRRIESHELEKHFKNITENEKVKSEDSAIKLIAHAADGSVRDGLSLLDQAIALGNGSVLEDDVKSMIGQADRSASLVLCSQILRGEMVDAISQYDEIIKSGCDPLQILQDISELIHKLTRAQIVLDIENIPEAEANFIKDLSNIKIPALTRAWQILLKGIEEVKKASHPIIATEMVLIRLSYAAKLPSPADLIKKLKEQKEKGEILQPQPSPNNGGGGAVSRFGNVQAVAKSQYENALEMQINMPTNFSELVELFAKNHEGTLYAELSSYVHLVKMNECSLEIRVEKKASKTLIPEATKHLQNWTKKRWVIVLSDEKGFPTLDEQAKEKERIRLEKIEGHPLMKSVRDNFSGAKIVSFKKKEISVIDDVVTDLNEE